MYEQRVSETAIHGSYETPQTERPEPPVMEGLARTLREEVPMTEPSVKKQTKQQILADYEIRIRFLSRGCVVNVGCKEIAFTTVDEAMQAIQYYVADPETVGEYWRGQFNM
jgi:hypothetical protein